MNLNKVILIGRISFQPTLTQSKSGFSYIRFNLAINRDNFNNNKNEVVDFVPVVAFGNNATFIDRFFNKGDLVSIVGSIQTSQYTSKNGDNITSCNIMVDQIKSLEPLSVTQQRSVNKNNNFDSYLNNMDVNHNQQPYNDNKIHEPTFYKYKEEENKDKEDQDDNPWELDL